MRGKLLRQIVCDVRERRFPYEGRAERKRDWRRYDAAQCREVVEVLGLIRELVDIAYGRVAKEPPVKRPVGRPPECTSGDVAKALLVQTYFRASNRNTEGYVILFSDRLGLSRDFSYKTVERGYDREEVKAVLDEVFRLTNVPIRDVEKTVSVDGTGFSTSVKQNYATDRAKQARNEKHAAAFPSSSHDYIFNVGVIGVEYKLYSAWIPSTDHHIAEASLYEDALIMSTQNNPNAETMLGDGVYATRPACQLTAKYGLELYALPARNVTVKKKGAVEWVDLTNRIIDQTQQFLKTYHMRSISETGNSTDKRAHPEPIRTKIPRRRKITSYLRAIHHNIKQLCYLTHTKNLDLNFSIGG